MLVDKRIIGLPSCKITSQREYKDHVRYTALHRGGRNCIRGCGTSCRIKESKSRTVLHGNFASRSFVVDIHFHKLFCPTCKISFHQRIDGVLKGKRQTEAFRDEIFSLHEAGASLSALGSQKEISPNTVSNIATEKLQKRLKETASRRVTCPTELGIDEHFFSKKDGFATTLVDLKKNQVFDIVLGRSELSLAGFLKKLKGKENVKLVVMDLSEPYRSIIQKHFPNARIVADRFHVVRVVMQHFSRLWHIISPEIKWRRGLGKLFRMHSWNLNEKQSEKLGDYLQKNEVVGQIYAKRNEISELLTRRNQKGFQMRKNVTELLKMIEELKQSPFPLMKTLATTLESWSAEIGRMWSSSKSNGVTEGFHNKMEVISRRAFGYKNFQNYRNRVLAMSKWNGKQSRRTFSWRKKRHPIEPKETAKQAAA